MTRIAFVDTETTGLSLDDDIWEFAAIIREPDGSDALSRAVGVEPDDFDRHTALGDAQWARAIYDAVTGPRRAEEDS